MIEALNEQTQLFAPDSVEHRQNNTYVLLDPNKPHWIGVDERGAGIIRSIGVRNVVGKVVMQYAQRHNIDQTKAWIDCTNFLREVIRSEYIATSPIVSPPYTGRADYLKPGKLEEVWLHTNNSCNLSCAHCLVSSSPQGSAGLSLEKWKDVITQSRELGAKTFFITGGEPFVRKDMCEIIDFITGSQIGGELTILTNAMLFKGDRLEALKRFRDRPLFFQVSLDGATEKTNDKIRGKGCFKGTLQGIKSLKSIGFETVLTTAVADSNHHEIPLIPKLAQEIGCKRIHLMWVHRKGRMIENASDFEISIEKVIDVVQKTKKVADELGIEIDNFVAMQNRVNSQPGLKYDLSSSGYSTMCVSYDGRVYPAASFVDEDRMVCGSVTHAWGNDTSLKQIWEKSERLNELRQATLQKKRVCKSCHVKYVCGGGDLEHGYFYSQAEDVLGHDPYSDLHKYMIQDAMFHWVDAKRKGTRQNTGYDSPQLYHVMGESSVDCGNTEAYEQEISTGVSTVRSNCVLSYEIDKARRLVRDFYGKAAEEPQEGLCCPTSFDKEEIAHIPQAVIDRFYGCGSPVSAAEVQPGETYLDLGSGGGIDCFIASKKVGPTGKIIGVDMTDQMLKVAHENRVIVEENLKFKNIEFRKGFLETVPVDDRSIDIVTSNCVINLSPDKKVVFKEIWRVLKDHGRIVISDIVTNGPIPSHLKINPRLWGECLSGALTENEFITFLEISGFYGLQLLKKVYWKSVEGYDFYSVTVRGYKFEKKKGCNFIGQKAIYRGPFKSITDEEGHHFLRDEIVEICTDTAAKLANAPYQGLFTIVGSKVAKSVDESFATVSSTDSCGDDTSCC